MFTKQDLTDLKENTGNGVFTRGEQSIGSGEKIMPIKREDAMQLKQRAQESLESDPRSTVADCSMILKVYGDDAKMRILRALGYEATGNYWAAMRDYNDALLLEPENANLFAHRAYLKGLILGQHETAIEDFNRAIQLQPNAFMYLNRGVLMAMAEEHVAAISDYTEALALCGDNKALPEIYMHRMTAYRSLGMDDKALADLSSVMAYPSTALDKGTASLAHAERGRLYFQQGRILDAFTDLSVAIENSSNQIEMRKFRCRLALKMGFWRVALHDVNCFLILELNSDKYLMRAASKKALGYGAEAERDRNTANLLENPRLHSLLNDGLMLFEEKRFDAAIEIFDELEHYVPNLTEMFFLRGNAKALMGRDADALVDFETAIKHDRLSEVVGGYHQLLASESSYLLSKDCGNLITTDFQALARRAEIYAIEGIAELHLNSENPTLSRLPTLI